MDMYMLITIFILGIKFQDSKSSSLESRYPTENCNCSWIIQSVEYKKGNEYLVNNSKDRPQSTEIKAIQYKSRKTGETSGVTMVTYTPAEFIICINSMVENDMYTLFVEYSNDKCVNNCTASFVFKAPEKIKRNIPIFVGIVAVVSLIIILMCFYNIRSKCIYRYILEIKRLPFIKTCGSNIPPTELDVSPLRRFTQAEIISLCTLMEEQMSNRLPQWPVITLLDVQR